VLTNNGRGVLGVKGHAAEVHMVIRPSFWHFLLILCVVCSAQVQSNNVCHLVLLSPTANVYVVCLGFVCEWHDVE